MLSSRKAILFAYYYLPDNTSGVQRAVRFAKYLPQFGIETFVIASSHAGVDSNQGNVAHVPTDLERAPRHQERIARLAQRIAPYNERIDWVPHAVKAAQRVIAEQKGIQTLISTSPPLATHMAALAIKRRYRLQWIADFRDPLYGNPGRPRRWARPYDMALERMIFSAADYVIAVTDTVAKEWAERYPGMRQKFRTIWNGFDPEDALRPAPIENRNHRELVHVGVLYSQRHPYGLMAGLERLVRRGLIQPQSIRLRFIGPIQERARFESDPACAALIQQGVVEIQGDLIPRANANALISAADFLLLIDIVNLSHSGYTVPAKLYDYILVGRPILALTDQGSPVDRILAKSGVPAVSLYHGDSTDEFDRKLLAFLQLSSDPVAPSPWFLENFDGRRQAESLAQLIAKG